MDAVDPGRFARITRVPNGYEQVLAGVRAAQRAGLNPVKVNCVLLRGFNDDQITAFGKFAREEGVVVRFIEFMPLEEDRVWSPGDRGAARRNSQPHGGIHAAARDRSWRQRNRTALRVRRTAWARSASSRRCRIPSADIAAASASPLTARSAPACSRCASTIWHRAWRQGASDQELTDFIYHVVDQKEERHHIGEPGFIPASRTMVHIGG